MAAPLPRETRTYVAVLSVAAAGAVVFAATVALGGAVDPLTFALGGASVLVGVFVAERKAVRFRWRDHRITSALTEIPIFLGLVLLAWPVLVLAVLAARIAIDVFARRAPVKLAFNAATGVLAATLGGVAFMAATGFHAPPLLAAILGTALYTFTSDALLSGLFATLESMPATRVYRERFLAPNLATLALTIPAAVVVLALWSLHPAALLATAPLAIFLFRHSELSARADREIAVHRTLARVAQDLAGTADEDAIAERVVATCRDLLDAGRARLALSDGQAWDRAFETAGVEGPPALAVPIIGRSGIELGTLSAWERPAKTRYGEAEREVLRIIAGQAATAIEGARAFAENVAQRDLLARQERLSSLGTLLAGVAHEVSNPLTYMRLRADLVRRDTEKALANEVTKEYAEKVEKNFSTIRQGLDRLDHLAQSLKATARPGDGTRAPTDVNEIIAHVVTVLKPGHKDIAFETSLDPQLGSAHANSAEIHQVLFNLAKNAVEAIETTPNARLRLATRREGERIVVEVADNGPGMPPEVRARLFTPFFTTKKKGTGLGLSITHRIVTAHGGEIQCESEAGKGTRFTVRLPASSGSNGSAPAA